MGPSLQGKVCLVTGAARGIGRGELLFNIIEVSGISFWGIWLLGIGRVELPFIGVSGIEVSGSGVFDYFVSAELICY